MKAEDESLADVSIRAPLTLTKTLFLRNLFQFLRQSDLHSPDNKIFDLSLASIMKVLQELMDQLGAAGVHLVFRGEFAYINQRSVRPNHRELHVYRHLCDFLRRRRLKGFKIITLPKPEKMRIFLWELAHLEKGSDRVFQFNSRLRAQGLEEFEVEVSEVAADGLTDEDHSTVDTELAVAALYKRFHKFVEVCFDNYENPSAISQSPIQQALIELSSLGDDDLVHMLRLISIKRYDRALPHMAVNACFLMGAWAKSLRLPSAIVIELAGAALAHPLIHLVRQNNTKELSRDELKANILQMIEALKGVWPQSDLQLLCALEWHETYQERGLYQVGSLRCQGHFISRMVRIVAHFEELTTYQKGKNVFLPEEAIAELLKPEIRHDPTLLKLFVNWIGIYPLGTLVELQTGEIGEIFAAGSNPLSFQRPVVRIIRDSQGQSLARPIIVDLSDVDDRLRVYKRSIRRSIRPEVIAQK